MSTIENDLICVICGAHGPDVPFPIFPLSGKEFGEICADCDEKTEL